MQPPVLISISSPPFFFLLPRPQAMNVGVALPTWLFTKDSKLAPLMLLGLVGFGILLPLGGVSWYMLNSNRYSGPNGVMQETLSFYYASKYSVKEAQVEERLQGWAPGGLPVNLDTVEAMQDCMKHVVGNETGGARYRS